MKLHDSVKEVSLASSLVAHCQLPLHHQQTDVFFVYNFHVLAAGPVIVALSTTELTQYSFSQWGYHIVHLVLVPVQNNSPVDLVKNTHLRCTASLPLGG